MGMKLRAASVVILMILSLFLTICTSSGAYASVYPSQNNIYVNGVFVINESTIDPLTGLPGQYGLRGNLIVNSTGTLIIDNATLYFEEDVLHHYRMYVNGSLVMDNAKITVSTSSLQPYLDLNISFFSAKVKISHSEFMFPGNVYFNQSNVFMANSKFDSIKNASSIFNNNIFSFAPTPYFSGSTVYLYNDYFNSLFSLPPISTVQVGNFTSSPTSYNFTGTKVFSAVTASLPYNSAMDINQINLYIVYKSNAASNVSLFIGKKKVGNATLPSSDNSEKIFNASIPLNNFVKLSQLENNLYAYIYENSSNKYMDIISLNFEIYTNDTFYYYGGPSTFYITFVNSVAYGMNVYFDINYNNFTMDNNLLKNPQKNAINLVNSNIYIVNMTVNNVTNIPLTQQDPPFLLDSNSNAVIYRYVYLTLRNYQGFPINHYDAILYPNEGSQASNSLASSLNSLLENNLELEGLLPSTFNYTFNGKALIPVVTDIVNYLTYPNSNILGHYILNSEGITANITLDSFPALSNSSNYRLVNLVTNDTFINYKLVSYTEPVYGSGFTVKVNATSYGNSIGGNFILLQDGNEIYTSPAVTIPSDASTLFNFNVLDSLKPGNYTLSLEFVSNTMFSSNMPVNFNITSHSNVSIQLSGYISPEYSMDGSWISGFPGTLHLNVSNFGSQPSGTFNVSVISKFPNGTLRFSNYTLDLNGGSSFKISQNLFVAKLSSPGFVTVTANVSYFKNIYPMNMSGSSLKLSIGVVPIPTLILGNIQISGPSYNGLPISGTVTLTPNEPITNVTLDYTFGNYSSSIRIPFISGQEVIPFQIPGSAVHAGNRVLSFYYNNASTPYITGELSTSIPIYVNPNYEFRIIQSPFILSGNITNFVNGSNLLLVQSVGLNYSSYVPVALYYSGTEIFVGNISTGSNVPINVSIPYSSNMTLDYYINYNNLLPSYQGPIFYSYTIPIPYYSIINNMPSSVVNGSSFSGNIVINSVSNFQSNSTYVRFSLGQYTVFSQVIGNLSIGQGLIIPINFNTSSIPAIMQGLNQISYPMELSIETPNLRPYFINFSLGEMTIQERANFAVTNISITPSQLFEGEPFNLTFVVENNGGSYFSGKLPYEVVIFNPSPFIIYTSVANVSLYPGGYTQISVDHLTYNQAIVGTIQIYLNYNYSIRTKSIQESNVTSAFSVLVPKITFTYSVSNLSPTEGQNVVLVIRSVNSIINKPWPVNFTIIITSGSKTIFTYTGTTSSSGTAILNFKASVQGSYNLEIVYQIGQTKQSYSYSSFIKAKAAPLVIPIYVYPLVAIAALLAAFAIGISYVRSKTSNMMQCSVCGALIPADSLKCPRCGTEFEKDMVRCSECDSWIPEDSKYCPNCGAVFLSKKDPEYSILMKLKTEYDKFVGDYRAKAKVIFGEKMSEGEFQKWWKSNPEYKGFKEWLTDKGISPDLSNASSSDSKNNKPKRGLFRK